MTKYWMLHAKDGLEEILLFTVTTEELIAFDQDSDKAGSGLSWGETGFPSDSDPHRQLAEGALRHFASRVRGYALASGVEPVTGIPEGLAEYVIGGHKIDGVSHSAVSVFEQRPGSEQAVRGNAGHV